MAADARLVGQHGSYHMNAVTAYSAQKFSMLYVISDCVFTRLTAKTSDGATYDFLVSGNWTGATVTQGTVIPVPEGHWISAITMSSGTCEGIKTKNSLT